MIYERVRNPSFHWPLKNTAIADAPLQNAIDSVKLRLQTYLNGTKCCFRPLDFENT